MKTFRRKFGAWSVSALIAAFGLGSIAGPAEAGKTMDEVVSSVRRVSDIVAEISAARAEQSTGIGQVNQAIVQMDGVTQQNAALVEEAAAAAESLQQQAATLVALVGEFKLEGSEPQLALPSKPGKPAPARLGMQAA